MDGSERKKFNIKDFVKVEPTTARLQSLRLPRDLSLGGTKVKKRNYVPNLNVVRNKERGKEVAPKIDKIKKEFKHNNSKKDNSRFVRSSGVFSEGIGGISQKSLARRERNYNDNERHSHMDVPVVKNNSVIIDKSKEDRVIENILNEDEFGVDEDNKMSFAPIQWDESAVANRKCPEIKQEHLELTDYFSEKNNMLSLWRMPDTLPVQPELKGENKGDCKLTDMPEGKIGKILIRKSGRIEIYIGSSKYELEPTNIEPSTEELVAIDNDKANAVVLGEIERRFLVNPDWEYLLK